MHQWINYCNTSEVLGCYFRVGKTYEILNQNFLFFFLIESFSFSAQIEFRVSKGYALFFYRGLNLYVYTHIVTYISAYQNLPLPVGMCATTLCYIYTSTYQNILFPTRIHTSTLYYSTLYYIYINIQTYTWESARRGFSSSCQG